MTKDVSNKSNSSRKAEANRRNAQLSTGPKTPEGKAKSSQNAVTHGIFVKNFLHGATPETVTEIEALAEGLREHYEPIGMLEELLLRKAIAEAGRCDRAFKYEQQLDDGNHVRTVICLGHVVRYTTSTSRAFYRAIEELERVQADRKARETLKTAAESTIPTDAVHQGQPTAPQSVSGTTAQSTAPPKADDVDVKEDDLAA